MAKLYAELRSETGAEKRQIANRQLCTDIYYGSKEESIKAVTVCASIEPEDPKTVRVSALFVSRAGEPLQYLEQKYPMPQPKPVMKMVV